jgi:uncharacterized protein (DUF983 family)
VSSHVSIDVRSEHDTHQLYHSVATPLEFPAKTSDKRKMLSEGEPLRPVLWRGWRGRCPRCGEGRLLHSYLKVNATCSSCGQEFHHHRADDGPAYLSILIVGHLMVPVLLTMWEVFRPEPIVLAGVACSLATVLALYLLPRLKGAMIAYQWAKGMHGFGKSSG